MEFAVGAERVTAVTPHFAGPVREASAGFLEDRDESRTIPRVHDGIHHHVEAAGRDETMPVAVTPAALHLRRVLQACPSVTESIAQHAGVRISDRRIIQAVD